MKTKSFFNNIKKHKYKSVLIIIIFIIICASVIFTNSKNNRAINISENISISSTIISDVDFLNTVKFDSLNSIKYMLEVGANPEAIDENSRNAMSIAASFSNNPALIKLLREFNVDINHKDVLGYTPLMFAIIANNSQGFIETLIKNGANVNDTNHFGSSILMIALALNSNNKKLVETLIKNGANVNYQDPHNVTPLMVALKITSNPDVIETLIKNGAKINVRDDLGISAKDILKSNSKLTKHPQLLEIFK